MGIIPSKSSRRTLLLRPNLQTIGAAIWFTLAMPTPSLAQAVSGAAIAVDGDSLSIGTTRIRLFGIDAPELKQTCLKDGAPWQCGEAAKTNLAELIAGQTVYCQGQGVDQHARLVAICTAGSLELNETMVAYGWALAYREFSGAYVPAELQARTNGLGIWSSKFLNPWDYRLGQIPGAVTTPAKKAQPPQRRRVTPPLTGCVIKGNRSRRGEWIYHLPGMPYYDQTRAEEIFCTEAEARAAGYRRAVVRN